MKKRVGLVGLTLTLGVSVIGVQAYADEGYEAGSSAECTTEFPVFETFEDGSAGCYREAEPEWQPGEFERIMLNDPEYDQDETLRTLGVTYEEAVALGWITVEPTTGPTAKPGLPKAGV